MSSWMAESITRWPPLSLPAWQHPRFGTQTVSGFSYSTTLIIFLVSFDLSSAL